MTTLRRRLALAAVLTVLLAPAVLRADEPEPADRTDDTVVIGGKDGHGLSLRLDGTELTIVTDDEDGKTTRIVDVEEVGKLVRDSLDEAFAALKDAQLDVHMGADNRLDFSHGDETVEVDVDAILDQVRDALQGLDALDALDTADWSRVGDRDRSDDELRDQLRELKREVRRLRHELRDKEL